MNVWNRIFRRSSAAAYQGAALLDHLPFTQTDDWRRERVLQAAQKYGKPFKCGGPDVPYERLRIEPRHLKGAEAAPLVRPTRTRSLRSLFGSSHPR